MTDSAIVKAFDIPDAWYKVVQKCMMDGYERPVYRGARQDSRRKELGFLFLEITNPSNRPLVPDISTVPGDIPPPVDMNYVNRYVEYMILPTKTDLEPYTYGERMAGMIRKDKVEGVRMSGLGLNQLGIIKGYLKETPGTNRSIIAIGKAEDLLLDDPPCMRLLQWKAVEDVLDLALYFRSWDAWGGLPGNLAALQLVKESLARECDLIDGKIYASSMGAHVYSQEWEIAAAVTLDTRARGSYGAGREGDEVQKTPP